MESRRIDRSPCGAAIADMGKLAAHAQLADQAAQTRGKGTRYQGGSRAAEKKG